MRTVFPSLNSGFSYSCSGLLCRLDKKSELLIFVGIKPIEQVFSGIHDCDELRQFVNVLVCIFFHVTVKYLVQGSFCTFTKCSLDFTPCRVNLFSFTFAKFSQVASKFFSPVNPSCLGSIIVYNHGQKCTNPFFGIVCFHSLCIYGSIKNDLTN